MSKQWIIFNNTSDGWPDDLVSLGCPLNNLTQELSASDEAIKHKTKAVLTELLFSQRTTAPGFSTPYFTEFSQCFAGEQLSSPHIPKIASRIDTGPLRLRLPSPNSTL